MASFAHRALVVLLALVMASAALVVAGSGSSRAAAVSAKGPTIVTGGPEMIFPGPDADVANLVNQPFQAPSYWEKMSASVQAAALVPSGTMEVAIYTTEVANLGALLRKGGVDTTIGSVPSTSSNLRVVTVEVPAKLLEKLAALDTVVAVAPAITPQVPDRAYPDLPGRTVPIKVPAPSIIEAGKGHRVPQAWALGFTGYGVNVAVMDSGVDFGNPDLQGTFARVTDSGSPYYDWPIAFDPSSMAQYLLAGLTFPTSPGSWYVNTSFTSGADFISGDLDAPFNGHVYNVAGIPSASGVYHLGVHPDNTLNYYWFGEPAAVLLTDSVMPGVYDTVYVDLNDDYAFGNDKPADISSPEIWADFYDADTDTYDFSYWDSGDGIADVSGGMIYFIADGFNPIPYSDVLANRYGLALPTPSNGDLVAFMIGDITAPGGDHGTFCASSIVAQNVTGHVLGFAPDARLIAVGNIYAGGFPYDIYTFVSEGYDGQDETGDEAQVASASFGYSGVYNDGWDYEARWVELNTLIYPGTAFTVATGNGGHGFGTVTSPGSSNGVIAVGASTSYNMELGADGFEDAAHSTFGDVQPWSNRGPSAVGMAKPDVVTVGAWATGDGALNSFFFSPPWTVWGGTSLSAPATAGIEALIAQAWMSNSIGAPFMNIFGKMFLVNSADNIHYDAEVMGHGLANAYRAVRAASLQDGLIAYDLDTLLFPGLDWAAGDYRGVKYPSFARIMSPGEYNTTALEIVNANFTDAKDVAISDWELDKTGSQTFYVNATNALESPLDFLRPDYLIDLTPDIPVGTNLVKVTVTLPMSQFDPDGDYVRESSWRLVLYDWADYNGNGEYWNDLDSNGVVNDGEMDNSAGTEVMRFTYGYPTGTNLEAFVHDPLDRIHEGLLIGIQHRYSSADVPFSNLTVTVDYYAAVDAPWLSEEVTFATIPLMGSIIFALNVTLPADQPYGTLSAIVTITDDQGQETQFPVTVNVAATGTDFAFGGDPDSVAFLDNNRVFGGFDWSWRAEAGDWRFFFTDIPDSTPVNQGDTLLVHTWWENVPTDLDTIIMGPEMDIFSGLYAPDFWGPYTLGTVGQSANTLISAGAWAFQTATGGAEEWVSAPLQTGLHEIALHNVLYAGLSPSEVFGGEVGRFGLSPSPWTVFTQNLTGASAFATSSSLDLPGLDVLAFGISRPVFMDGVYINTSNPWLTTFSATDIGVIDIEIQESSPQGMDLDLYLLRFTGPGYTLVASSAGPTASERIRLTMPEDGDYAVLVDPYSIPAGSGNFDYVQVVVAGSQLLPSDVPSEPIPAGTPSGFNVSWNLPAGTRPGWYFGVLFVGPSGAPAVEVDTLFYLYDGYAPEILTVTPSDGAQINTKAPAIVVTYEDPEVTSGIDRVQFAIDGMDLSFAGRWNETTFLWSFPFDLSEGVHAATVLVLDEWGWWSSYEWSFTVDTAAPNLDVTAPSATLTNDAIVDVTGSTDPDASIEVNGVPVLVDPGTGAFATSMGLAEGSNLITTVATDPAGNTAVDTRTIVLDTIPPALDVTDPLDGDLVNTNVVHVAGTAEVGASLVVNGVSVAIDSGGDWGIDLAFSDGDNTITTTAKDAAGNAVQDVRTVTVDTLAPALEVTSPSYGLTRMDTVTVEGITEAGADLTVDGDTVLVQPDGSFSTVVALAEGPNTIEIEATDAAGNSAMATRTVVLDSAMPDLVITSPADGVLVNVAVVHVAGTAEPGSQVTVNGVMVVVSGAGAWDVDLSFGDGVQEIRVVATDAAGNSNTVLQSVTVDTVGPALEVTSPVYSLTNDASATVSGTTEVGATVTVNGAAATVGPTGAFSESVTLATGPNTITVVSTDGAGNSATVVKRVTYDGTAPSVAITAPAASTLVNTDVVHVTGTAEAGAQVTVNGVIVVLSGTGAWSVDLSFADGSQTITVVATDAAGNTATASRSFTVDTTPPTIALSEPTAALTNSGSVVVSGVVSDPGATVTVNGNPVTVSGAGAFSTTVSLADGVRTIYVNATDSATNEAAVTRTITVDTHAPVVTVSAPANGLQTDAPTVIVSGTVDDATATILVNGIQVHPSGSGAWSVPVTLSEGTNSISVSAVDAAGNVATLVTRQVTYASPITDLQNGISAANTNLLYAILGLIAAIAVVGAVVYWRLSKRMSAPKVPPPPPEDDTPSGKEL